MKRFHKHTVNLVSQKQSSRFLQDSAPSLLGQCRLWITGTVGFLLLVLAPVRTHAASFGTFTGPDSGNSAQPCLGSTGQSNSPNPLESRVDCGPNNGQLSTQAIAGGGFLGVRTSSFSNGARVGGAANANFFENAVIIDGGEPGPKTIPVSLNLAFEGSGALGLAGPGHGVTYDISISVEVFGQFNLTSQLVVSANDNGVHVTERGNSDFLHHVVDSAGDSGFDVIFTTPVFMFNTGNHLILRLTLRAATVAVGSGSSAVADFSNTFGFPVGMDVFNLPPGFTANAPDLNLINNRFIDPNAPLDHFLGYSTKSPQGSPRFTSFSVFLSDQFEEGSFTVTKPVNLANPADKNGEGIHDPVTHLEGYRIAEGPKHIRRDITVNNQFGELQLTTLAADRLLVPTAKSLTEPVDPPDPDSHNVDHFKCYTVKVTKGAPKFPKGLQATVSDQFTDPPKVFDLKKPTRLCAPVSKEDESIKNPDISLMCYQIKAAKGQAKHQKVLGVHLHNQFGAEQIDTVKEEELCVPSTKTLPGASLNTDPVSTEERRNE